MTNPPETMPLVTIVVPVFNGEKHLKEALDSILAQTYPNVELLVMDDASTDGTPGILVAYGPRVKVVRQQTNRGQFPGVNDGIARARSEWVAVYHADDVHHPEIVSREVRVLKQQSAARGSLCLDRFIDGEGCNMINSPFNRWFGTIDRCLTQYSRTRCSNTRTAANGETHARD